MSKKNKISTARFLNAKITSTASITLVLVMLGITILIVFMGNGLSNFVKENMSFTIMLDEAATDNQIASIHQKIDNKPYVKSSRFISKEEAKQELIKELGEDPEELLGYNPANPAIEIFLHSKYANTDSIATINEDIRQTNNVNDLLYQHEAITIINDNLSKVMLVLLILALVLIFISFTLIRNTIRLSIYSKRFLINTMKLVGATGAFIRRPFVISTVFTGILAGLLADGIIYGLIRYFSYEYGKIDEIVSTTDLLIIFAIVVILGVLLTWWATTFAVNRYLKLRTENLYYI